MEWASGELSMSVDGPGETDSDTQGSCDQIDHHKYSSLV
jgi:hypothetical protein